MPTKQSPERVLFTFQHNGEAHGKPLVEVTAEHLLEHEAPVRSTADRLSWFGAEDKLGAALEPLGFPAVEIEGILSTLRSHRIATREAEASAEALRKAGFAKAQ